MIGVGVEQNTEKITRNYSRLLSLKLSNTKVHIFLTSLHHLSMELAIMEYKEEETHIFGQSGQEELSSSPTSQMLVISIVSLVLKLSQFGKLS